MSADPSEKLPDPWEERAIEATIDELKAGRAQIHVWLHSCRDAPFEETYPEGAGIKVIKFANGFSTTAENFDAIRPLIDPKKRQPNAEGLDILQALEATGEIQIIPRIFPRTPDGRPCFNFWRAAKLTP
jgi:hypothetical protein